MTLIFLPVRENPIVGLARQRLERALAKVENYARQMLDDCEDFPRHNPKMMVAQTLIAGLEVAGSIAMTAALANKIHPNSTLFRRAIRHALVPEADPRQPLEGEPAPCPICGAERCDHSPSEKHHAAVDLEPSDPFGFPS